MATISKPKCTKNGTLGVLVLSIHSYVIQLYVLFVYTYQIRPDFGGNYSLMRYKMLIAASRGSICVAGRHCSSSIMAKIRGKFQAIHRRAAARGLPAIITAIETVRRDVFSRQLSDGQITVVVKCEGFVYNLHIQSKKNN